MITPIGTALLVLLVVCLVAGKSVVYPLAVAAGLPAATMFDIAGRPVPAFFAMVLLIAPLALGRSRERPRKAGPLLFFGLYASVITLLGPLLFDGLLVNSPEDQSLRGLLLPLAFSEGNAAQFIYLWLGIAAVFIIAQSRFNEIVAGSIGLSVGVLLSFLELASSWVDIAWPERVFDNSATFVYIQTDVDGSARFRGIFPEPSLLATVSLAAIALAIFSIFQRNCSLRLRVWSMFVMGMAFTILSVSDSATAVLAPALSVAIVGLVLVGRFLAGRMRLRPEIAVAATFGLVFTFPLLLTTLERLLQTLQEKRQSLSFSTRFDADFSSLGIFVDSAGLGVGLGSNRPGSFLPMLLSCVGLLGTGLLIWVFIRLIGMAWLDVRRRPIAAAFLVLLVCKCVAGPDLNSPAVLWVLAGILASRQSSEPEVLKAKSEKTSLDA